MPLVHVVRLFPHVGQGVRDLTGAGAVVSFQVSNHEVGLVEAKVQMGLSGRQVVLTVQCCGCISVCVCVCVCE